MQTYRYAYSASGEVVDVLSLPPRDLSQPVTFTCVGCGQEMIGVVNGLLVDKHFRHKTATADCGRETYLHKLAKETFLRTYQQCLLDGKPFNIGVSHQQMCSKFNEFMGEACVTLGATKTHDLTKFFDGVRLEKRDGSFVPDLTLTKINDPNQKIYIEIAVTHLSTERKRKSGNRIIEIRIENESDLRIIEGRYLSEINASFFNFNPTPVDMSPDACACANSDRWCLFIYASGKAHLEKAPLQALEAKWRRRPERFAFRLVMPSHHIYSEPDFVFKIALRKARRKGQRIQNCFLCKYRRENWNRSNDDQPIYCLVKKIVCNSNEAVTCKMFREDRRGYARE